MPVIALCDICKRSITAGPISCSQCVVDNSRLYAEQLRARVDRLQAVVTAARAWNARICWAHTDPDDEEKALHEAVVALEEGGEERG